MNRLPPISCSFDLTMQSPLETAAFYSNRFREILTTELHRQGLAQEDALQTTSSKSALKDLAQKYESLLADEGISLPSEEHDFALWREIGIQLAKAQHQHETALRLLEEAALDPTLGGARKRAVQVIIELLEEFIDKNELSFSRSEIRNFLDPWILEERLSHPDERDFLIQNLKELLEQGGDIPEPLQIMLDTHFAEAGLREGYERWVAFSSRRIKDSELPSEDQIEQALTDFFARSSFELTTDPLNVCDVAPSQPSTLPESLLDFGGPFLGIWEAEVRQDLGNADLSAAALHNEISQRLIQECADALIPFDPADMEANARSLIIYNRRLLYQEIKCPSDPILFEAWRKNRVSLYKNKRIFTHGGRLTRIPPGIEFVGIKNLRLTNHCIRTLSHLSIVFPTLENIFLKGNPIHSNDNIFKILSNIYNTPPTAR